MNDDPALHRAASSTARVVLVDDDARQLQALRLLLQQRGMDVHVTARSGEALSLIRRVAPDLVVLDVHMPRPDGFDLCRAVRDGVRPPPAVLFVSGDDATPQVVEGLEAGAVDFVRKDTDVACLIAKVEAAARLGARMKRLANDATHDALTGLAHRGALAQRGAELVAVARRHGRPLACLMLDADRFKAINDRHGHAAGDAVLVELARRLEQGCRAGDLVFRVGGEEFVVLAAETDGAAALRLAERLRGAIQRRPFAVPTPAGGRRQLVVTVSVGVAAWRDGATLDGLVAAADRALYEAKRRGRNRVVGEPGDRPAAREGTA